MTGLLQRCVWAVGAFLVIWVIVMVAIEAVVGVIPYNATIASVFGLGAAIYVLMQKHPPSDQLHARLRARSRQAVETFNAAPRISVYGREMDRPAFLNTVRGFYNRPGLTRAWYEGQKNNIVAAGIPPLTRNSLNERRMFESLLESARYEMLRRGLPIVDRLNRDIEPTIHPEGLLIESVPNDDGSTSHILAIDLLGGLDRDDWAKAQQHGIGRSRSAWNEKPYALITSRLSEQGLKDPGTGIMPLYRVELTEIVTPATAAIDPLAGPGVSIDYPVDLPRG